MFSWTPFDLGYTSAVKYEIALLSDTRIAQPYHRIEDARHYIQEMANKGITKPSLSLFASPIMVVRMKVDSIRLCVDYRKLKPSSEKMIFLYNVLTSLLICFAVPRNFQRRIWPVIATKSHGRKQMKKK
ncbi:hypothetical protein PoB_001262400 [Plakobranchus ocellatus]|uniref:Reverse transcriptase domain-containing protein n=1 Tax=Plakobranchus ocellatus TaxID=259542 RepID=A0AAV3YVN9_9GAST|nr:hypothetical protein PoB_001262400 [Plakobranchus ocellatus]